MTTFANSNAIVRTTILAGAFLGLLGSAACKFNGGGRSSSMRLFLTEDAGKPTPCPGNPDECGDYQLDFDGNAIVASHCGGEPSDQGGEVVVQTEGGAEALDAWFADAGSSAPTRDFSCSRDDDGDVSDFALDYYGCIPIASDSFGGGQAERTNYRFACELICDPADPSCAPGAPNGASCVMPSECDSGNCVDSVCCDTACVGTCESCLGVDTGGDDGTCGNIVDGTDPNDECASGSCDGNGSCGLDPLPLGQSCVAGFECDSGNCVDGVCCDSPCAGGCEACVGGATGADDGQCAPVEPGNDDGSCPMGAVCDGAGSCQPL
jgi:hypothetical protein